MVWYQLSIGVIRSQQGFNCSPKHRTTAPIMTKINMTVSWGADVLIFLPFLGNRLFLSFKSVESREWGTMHHGAKIFTLAHGEVSHCSPLYVCLNQIPIGTDPHRSAISGIGVDNEKWRPHFHPYSKIPTKLSHGITSSIIRVWLINTSSIIPPAHVRQWVTCLYQEYNITQKFVC